MEVKAKMLEAGELCGGNKSGSEESDKIERKHWVIVIHLMFTNYVRDGFASSDERPASILDHMWHPPPGFAGLVTAILILVIAGLLARFAKKYDSYDIDPRGVLGTFEPILARYLRIAEFIVGIDTGSIVLIVGSSALHGQSGHLPWVYASPLLLLSSSVIYGVIFMSCLIMNDENARHGNPHTATRYAMSETFGFSALGCFCAGYIFLAVMVTRYVGANYQLTHWAGRKCSLASRRRFRPAK